MSLESIGNEDYLSINKSNDVINFTKVAIYTAYVFTKFPVILS